MEHIKQNLKDFIFVSKYSRTVGNTKESWEDAVHRVMTMHKTHLREYLKLSAEKLEQLEPYLKIAERAYLDQKILGAQRALQWGGTQLLTKHMRMYNCAGSAVDRPKFFGELMWVLLAGAGGGYSVQTHHVAKLPTIRRKYAGVDIFYIEDSIEGWADSIQILIDSYMYEDVRSVVFDYSKIRPKGSLISGGFKAPGPAPLKKAHELIRSILDNADGRQLRPIEAHDINCILADAVVSGGVRRSALLALFSADDDEMASCKTGDWLIKAPWRARANNSAVILPTTPKHTYDNVFSMTQEFGEPGFAFMKNRDYLYNPCFEVGMYPYFDGESGWSFCNLTEINGHEANSREEFKAAGIAAAVLGTIQASYTTFDYLTETTKKIVERDALIGVGITGMAENPNVLFNPEYQREVAEAVLEVNAEIAKILGINPAVRSTVVKPSGNSAQMLGTASGVHPFHSKRKYIRNVQINKEEQVASVIQEQAPLLIEQSVWSDNDVIVSFPIDLSYKEDSIIAKEDLTAIKFLDMVKSTQANWISNGTRIDHPAYDPYLTHNVSNTITVNPGEWLEVREYLWNNKEYFAGVSLLGASGDLDYPQAPFVEVLDEVELAERYGPAAILAGGLNVDGIHAFGDLWKAIDTALGRGEDLTLSKRDLINIIDQGTDEYMVGFEYKVGGLKLTDVNSIIVHLWDVLEKKKLWVDRFKKFSSKYLGGDLEATGHCLKQVSIFHKWNQLLISPTINWNNVQWHEELKEAGSEVATACAGGKCEI